MNRIFCLLFCLLLSGLFLAAKKPNVLLIVSDDMGWDDIGYVNSKINTPNLDRLAREGVRLERFYANPLCSVTRSALMTGRATLLTGVSNRRGLPLHYPIMAESFEEAGYATWMLGKWHLGGSRSNHFNTPDYLPHNRGFDHFYGHLNGALHYESHTVGSEHGPADWWRNGKAVKEKGFQTALLTDEAIKLIEKRDEETPFFLYLAYHAPHTPLSKPPSGMELYPTINNESQKLVYANTTFMDTEIGRLVDLLEQRGELEDTLILFFNDNGGVPRSGSSNLPLRAQKGTVYEGGIRVRAFARWPKMLPQYTINYQFMCVMDLFPTLASAAGIDLPGSMTFDGTDLWRALVNDNETSRPDFIMGTSDIAVYRPPWKLIIPSGGQSPELYNIVEDPYEKKEISSAHGKVVRELNTVGQAMIAQAEASPVGNAGQGGRGRVGRGGRPGDGPAREGESGRTGSRSKGN